MTLQRTLTLPPMPRGVHLITRQIEPEIREISTGIAHLFLQHSSASLAINENYDPDVRRDVEHFLRTLIPDGWAGFTHTLEGPDDMPAHMKNILIGSSLTIPVTDGRLALGTWQGIYLLEHREHGGERRIVITLMGE
ncbi:secondary thiamine-phosphate synthase enzyme YjbQ [Nitratifractor sp.]